MNDWNSQIWKLELVREYEAQANLLIKTREKWWKKSREAFYAGQNILGIPDFPEKPHRTTFGEGSIHFAFRYDKFLIQELRKLFLDSGYKLDWESKEENITDSYSDPTLNFVKDGFEIYFLFSDKIKGSTCKRQKIGKQMKEVDVYEWNCEGVEK